jgi:hypothetical protein
MAHKQWSIKRLQKSCLRGIIVLAVVIVGILKLALFVKSMVI